jgi:transcriptional regulator with XRE-family HTH domain
MTVKEAAKRLGVTRPNLSRILNGRARHFSSDEGAACSGDALHVS